MKVSNEVYPLKGAQADELRNAGPEGPIYMVNLLKFKDKATYKEGTKEAGEPVISGQEAYARYGQAVSQLIQDYGGEVIFAGRVTYLSIGQVDDLWDQIAIAKYPSRKAFLEMSSSKEFLAFSYHREAGLQGQLNIETVSALSWGAN